MNDQEAILRERHALKTKYGDLFSSVSRLLFEADLQSLNYGSNTDEYDSEAATILPRLEGACGENDVTTIIFEEFCRWFGPQDIANRESYAPLARRIWDAWCAFKERDA